MTIFIFVQYIRIDFCSFMLWEWFLLKELYWHVLLIFKILICLCMGHVCIHRQYHFLSFVKEHIWMYSPFQIGMLCSLKTKLQLKLDEFEDPSLNCPYLKRSVLKSRLSFLLPIIIRNSRIVFIFCRKLKEIASW